MSKDSLRSKIEAAWEDRALLKTEETQNSIREVIEFLDKGTLRVAEPDGDDWKVNEWVKKAVVLYFPIQKMETIEVGPFEFHDKMKLKTNYAALGVRVVPHAVARYGAYLSKGVIMVPRIPLDLTSGLVSCDSRTQKTRAPGNLWPPFGSFLAIFV